MAGASSANNHRQNLTTIKKKGSLTIDVLLGAGKVNRLDAANLLSSKASSRAGSSNSRGADGGASNRVGSALLESRGDQLAGDVGAQGL